VEASSTSFAPKLRACSAGRLIRAAQLADATLSEGLADRSRGESG
jgi:hypothetical protein